MAVRDKKFTFVLTDEEREQLEALASSQHRTASDWIRVAVKVAYAEQFGNKKPPKTKRKKR